MGFFVSGTSAFTAKIDQLINTNDVRFTDVLYNEGNDYNSTTGVFTCRIPGIYWFSATLYGHSGGWCFILLNDLQNALVGMSGSTYDSGTGSEVFRLKPGDRVQLGQCTDPSHLAGSNINTFAGVLVKAYG